MLRRNATKHSIRLFATSLLLAALSGCGGGGGGGDGGDSSAPLTVTATTPADGATAVDVNTAVSVDFSTALDPASLASNLSLRTGSTDVPGTIAVADKRVTFTPSKPLALLTTYTATIGTGVAGRGGEALAAATTSSFTTRDGLWRGATQIGPDIAGNDFNTAPRLALDAEGDALAVWTHSAFATGTSTIWTARYDVANGTWSRHALSSDSGDSDSAAVAMNASGDGIAAWSRWQNDRIEIHASRYTASNQSWDEVQSVAGDEVCCFMHDVRVAIDGAGNAIVAWATEADFMTQAKANLWVRRFDAASKTWGETVKITGASEFALAMDPAGRAFLVWYRGVFADGGNSGIWVMRAGAGTSPWLAPQMLSDPAAIAGEGSDGSPAIVTDGRGNALAAWAQNSKVSARQFRAETGVWSVAEDIGGSDAWANSVGGISAALDAAGNAVVAWRQRIDARHAIHINRHNAATNAWAAPQVIDHITEGDAWDPQVALDPAGNGIAVWEQADSPTGLSTTIYSRRYVATSATWGGIETLVTPATSAWAPSIVIDAQGRAHAAWRQWDNVGFNRFE